MLKNSIKRVLYISSSEIIWKKEENSGNVFKTLFLNPEAKMESYIFR